MASTLMRVASSTCFPPAGILPGALVSLPVRHRLHQPIRWAMELARTSMRPEAEQRCPPNQETKMLIWMKFALCAAIVLSTAATASAATKKKTTAHRSGPLRAQPCLSTPTLLQPQAVVPLATITCSSAIDEKRWVQGAVTSGAVTMARNDPNSAACKRHAGQTSDSGCARSSRRSRRGSGAG